VNKFMLFLLLAASGILSYLILNFQDFMGTNPVYLPQSGFMVTVGAFLIIAIMCLAAGLLFAMKS
jgi:hypothetical protein